MGDGLFFKTGQELLMSDMAFIVGTIVFMALGILYLKGCERLK
jgi:hypothetical protein